MKKVNLPLVASALTLLFVTITFLHAGEPGYRETRIKWKRERISRGLLWIHAHTVEGDTLKQNINILIVDTRKKVIDIVYEPGQGRRKADIQAAEAGGTAAVNGGFFNAAGGSVTYLRNDGIIHDTDTATAWPRNANLNGAVMVEGTGRVHLIPRATNEWFDKNSQFIDILVSGPVLLLDGMAAEMPGTSLVTARHPRTAIGLKGKRKVMLVTVDGRTVQSHGLTLHQMADLMLSLGCSDAVNLDGGGSTTMWIEGKAHGGIVNMPCDNKQFDHEGARAVSSVIVVR